MDRKNKIVVVIFVLVIITIGLSSLAKMASDHGGLSYVFYDYSTTYGAELACKNQSSRPYTIDDQVYGCRQVIRDNSRIDMSKMTITSIDKRKADAEEARIQLEKIKLELEKRGVYLTAE